MGRVRLEADRYPNPSCPRRPSPLRSRAAEADVSASTILVVEDNPITRKMMRFALESEGFRVAEAGDGRAALTLAGEHPPDMVLQDFVLPDMDGLQLIDGLRRPPGMSSTPIIVVRGMVPRLEGMRSRPLPNTTFLPKPIEPSRLLEVVRAHLAAAATAR